MTQPSDDQPGERSGDDSGAPGGTDDAPFDPYRFGRPEHPVPPEFAPPGYVAPPAGPSRSSSPPPSSPPQGWSPYGSGPYPPPDHYDQQYGQQYGRPGPPWGTPPSSGKATAALVLGIAAIVLSVLTFLDAIVVVAALTLGALALNDTRGGQRSGRGRAIAGIVCAIAGAAIAVVLLVAAHYFQQKCGTSDRGNLEQCIRNRLGG